MGDESRSLEERVACLEVKVEGLQQAITSMKADWKADIEALKAYFESRDTNNNNKLWKLCFWLVGLLGAIVAAAFGITKVAPLL